MVTKPKLTPAVNKPIKAPPAVAPAWVWLCGYRRQEAATEGGTCPRAASGEGAGAVPAVEQRAGRVVLWPHLT